MSDYKLLPCLCGGKDISLGIHLDYATIWCPECKARITISGKRYKTLGNATKYYRPKLIEAWNTRAQLSRQQED